MAVHRHRAAPLTALFLGLIGLPPALAVRAQGQAAGLVPQFEVASIKINRAGPETSSISPYGTATFTARHVTVTTLLSMAFEINGDSITGGPGWIESEYYDVSAKAEDGVVLSIQEIRPRLRRLLEKRFRIATHRETRPQEGYALVVAKGGPKLKPGEPSATPVYTPGGVGGPNLPLPILAAVLQRRVGKRVVDETGITGAFKIALDYAIDPNDTTRPSIFTALEEQLGLKLEARSLHAEWLVIDRVEHPTPD